MTAADDRPILGSFQLQLILPGGHSLQLFNFIYGHQCIAMNPHKQTVELFFQFFKSVVNEGFAVAMHDGDVLLIGNKTVDIFNGHQLDSAASFCRDVAAALGAVGILILRSLLQFVELARLFQRAGDDSALAGVSRGLPEWQRAVKLQKRAADVGFDWPEAEDVLEKFDEEVAEIREAVRSMSPDAIEDEVGDLLFVVTNLARKLQIDPARALRRANAKFETRFRAVEQAAGGREGLADMTLDDMESLWQAAKQDGPR